MNRTTFYILIGMSALFGVIKFTEARLYDSCQSAQFEKNSIDARLESAQKLNVFNAELLKRLVVDSRSDPALSDLLKRHHVTVMPVPGGQNATSPVTPLVAPNKSLGAPTPSLKP